MSFKIAGWKDGFEREYKVVTGEPDKNDERIPINLILLTYNCDDYLEHCLKATENQVDKVYALDNMSNDNTIKILKDHNIDYRRSSIKGDLSKLMNLNLKRVPRGWCFYVNPDEILYDLPKGFIGKYCKFLEDNEIYASDVRFPDFIYNYGTLFAGFDWGEGPGIYWTARRLFRFTGVEQFRGRTHYNISNIHPKERGNPMFNYEHTGWWGGTVVKTSSIQLFHYGKCRGVERQRSKGERIVNGDRIATGAVATIPYCGEHPSVMGI